MNDEVERTATRVYNLARRLLNNEQDAAEVTEEVLRSFDWELDDSAAETELTHRLHAATVTAALACRKRAVSRVVVEAALEERAVLPRVCKSVRPQRLWRGEPELQQQEWQRFEQAMAALPEGHRDVFVLFDVEGLPEEEVATLLGLARPTVRRWLHQARLRMRDALFPGFERN